MHSIHVTHRESNRLYSKQQSVFAATAVSLHTTMKVLSIALVLTALLALTSTVPGPRSFPSGFQARDSVVSLQHLINALKMTGNGLDEGTYKFLKYVAYIIMLCP